MVANWNIVANRTCIINNIISLFRWLQFTNKKNRSLFDRSFTLFYYYSIISCATNNVFKTTYITQNNVFFCCNSFIAAIGNISVVFNSLTVIKCTTNKAINVHIIVRVRLYECTLIILFNLIQFLESFIFVRYFNSLATLSGLIMLAAACVRVIFLQSRKIANNLMHFYILIGGSKCGYLFLMNE